MKENYVGYELAVKLKEKGFHERVCGHYKSQYHLSICSEPMNCNGPTSVDISAPQIHEVLKWLREEKKIHIEIFLYDRKYSYFVKSITQICEDDLFHKCLNDDTTDEEYATFEQAAIAGIEYVLDNLI